MSDVPRVGGDLLVCGRTSAAAAAVASSALRCVDLNNIDFEMYE